MTPAKISLRDSHRGILILAAVLLFHLTLFLTFRHHVVWPAPPVSTTDFEFKMALPPLNLTNIPMPAFSPAVSVSTPSPTENSFPQIHLGVISATEAALNGNPPQPREFSEGPGYFAVPPVATEIPPWALHPVSSSRVFDPPTREHYRAAGNSPTTPNFGPHTSVGDLRKTVPR